jgi:hypothetical protein
MTIPVAIGFIIGLLGYQIINSSNIIALGIEMIIYVIIYSLLMWNFAMNHYEKELFIKPVYNIINKMRRKTKYDNN